MFLCASYMRMLIVKAEPGVSELRLCTALGRWTVRCGSVCGLQFTLGVRRYCLRSPDTATRDRRPQSAEKVQR